MQAPQVLSSVKDWRWTPCAAIILASLLYVALALAVVPTSVDQDPSDGAANAAPLLEVPAFDHATAAEPQDFDEPVAGAMPTIAAAPPPPMAPPQFAGPTSTRRGFSPPLPRAEVPMIAPSPVMIPTAPPPVNPEPVPLPEQQPPPPEVMEQAVAPPEPVATDGQPDPGQIEPQAGEQMPAPLHDSNNSPSVRAAAAARSAAALMLRGRRNVELPEPAE
jgi:hypothetical protein